MSAHEDDAAAVPSCAARDRQIARARRMHPFSADLLGADEVPLYEAARALERRVAAEFGRWKSGAAFESALALSQPLLTLVECAPHRLRSERARKARHVLECIDDAPLREAAFRRKRGDEVAAETRHAEFCAQFVQLSALCTQIYGVAEA